MYLDSIFSPRKEKNIQSLFLLFPYLGLFYYSYTQNGNKTKLRVSESKETLLTLPSGSKFVQQNSFFFWWQVLNDCKCKHYSHIFVVMLLHAIIMKNVKFSPYLVLENAKIENTETVK